MDHRMSGNEAIVLAFLHNVRTVMLWYGHVRAWSLGFSLLYHYDGCYWGCLGNLNRWCLNLRGLYLGGNDCGGGSSNILLGLGVSFGGEMKQSLLFLLSLLLLLVNSFGFFSGKICFELATLAASVELLRIIEQILDSIDHDRSSNKGRKATSTHLQAVFHIEFVFTRRGERSRKDMRLGSCGTLGAWQFRQEMIMQLLFHFRAPYYSRSVVELLHAATRQLLSRRDAEGTLRLAIPNAKLRRFAKLILC
mmetsp:Transcript_37721/g.82672  ORF Transcript_37721/g.82672 Transcript_37721/m.82672 type:complete len:250 (+) Transcript_37721:220-969(+)